MILRRVPNSNKKWWNPLSWGKILELVIEDELLITHQIRLDVGNLVMSDNVVLFPGMNLTKKETLAEAEKFIKKFKIRKQV